MADLKNSPENILKKMYNSEKRSWFNDCGFRSLTSLSMTHIVPDAVIPLTGNTTVKLDLEQYLLSEGTPNPVYEGMRVDVALYFCPQRLYTRGLYGNNIVEGVSPDKFEFPIRKLGVDYDPEVQVAFSAGLVLRGSLLNRLGVPAMCIAPGVNFPLVEKHIPGDMLTGSVRNFGAQNKSYKFPLNMSVVAAYYDICRTYFANKFVDLVPIENLRVFSGIEVDADSGLPVPGSDVVDSVTWQSLALFGRTINHVRGVMNSPNDYIDSYDVIFGEGLGVSFGPLDLLDFVNFEVDSSDVVVGNLVNAFESVISNTGLWPQRWDSHFQTMFFDPNDIDDLVNISLSSNVSQIRYQEAEFVKRLKQILRGRTVEDWIDIQFGRRLKIADEPIFVGSDSFIVNFNQIVASAQSDGVRLGDTASRAQGGSKRSYNEKGVNSKTITFTTQEPGYLISVIKCTPPVSYSDVVPRYLGYDTLDDFPLPAYSGKIFDDLTGKDFVFTGIDMLDNNVVGSQPYAFDHMTNYNRVSALMATPLKRGFSFVRQFNISDSTLGQVGFGDDFGEYLRSTYVQAEEFDNNFYDNGVNGRQNFSLVTAYNLRKCMPLEKQVTDYNMI